jgi:Phage integrase family
MQGMERARNCGLVVLAALTALLVTAAKAQTPDLRKLYPKMAPLGLYLMNRDAEITLARSAAPAAISRDASVLVLTRQGWETAVNGTSGFVCMVERGWAVSIDFAEMWNPQYGEPFHPDAMSNLARDLIAQANLGKCGSCHTFRHTMATLMLDNGANIRYIQQMLGHAEISSTEIYTHVAIRKLQKIHAATHPGATLERKVSAVASEGTSQANDERKTELMAALDVEAEEESE